MNPAPDAALNRRVIELLIRLALVVLLFGWCFLIVSPFLTIMVWALILAVAVYPAHRRLTERLGGRRETSAALFVLLGLLALALPVWLFAGSLIDGGSHISRVLKEGQLVLPAPPAAVAGWPLVGETVDHYWRLATDNTGELLGRFQPQLKTAAGWLLSVSAHAGLGLLQFLLAMLIAGVFLARADAGALYGQRLAARLSGERGQALLALAVSTLRSVARGVVGVALIQSLLAGIGFLAVGLPGAGLLTLLALLFCVAQIGPGLIVVPSVIYVFWTGDSTLVAVLYLAWSVLVVSIDNILKPLLLGRGVAVPMLVIFIGAIGGFLTSGFMGLFVGAIVLVLGYTVLHAWLNELPEAPSEPAP